MPDTLFSTDYIVWFSDLKQRISLARQQACLSLNSALIKLYWEISRDMVEKEERAAWGSGLIERLSRDLTHAFLNMKGFSRRNLYAIRKRIGILKPHKIGKETLFLNVDLYGPLSK